MTKKIKVMYAKYYVKQCAIEIEVPKTTRTSNVLDFIEKHELSQNINYEMEKAQLEKIPEVDYILIINDKKVLCDKYKTMGGIMQLISKHEYNVLKK